MSQQTSIVETVGGVRGMIETSAPAAAFVVAYLVAGNDTTTSAIVAVVIAVVMSIARALRAVLRSSARSPRRETPQFALSGLVGVAIAAIFASKTGKAENFFLPGLLLNAAYATAFLISILVRWPLVGVIAAQLQGDREWREDAERMTAYNRASWLWVILFGARLAVQLPLYLAGAVVALGIARTAMGIPLFALGLWLTYQLVRHHHPSGSNA